MNTENTLTDIEKIIRKAEIKKQFNLTDDDLKDLDIEKIVALGKDDDNYKNYIENKNQLIKDNRCFNQFWTNALGGSIILLLVLFAGVQINNLWNSRNTEPLQHVVAITIDKDSLTSISLNDKLESVENLLNDRFDAYDKKYEAFNNSLSTDISTLEMMLTIMTIVLALFAFLGIMSYRDSRKEIEEEKEKAEEKINKFEEKIERYEKQFYEQETLLMKYRKNLNDFDNQTQNNEERLKTCKADIDSALQENKHPSSYRAELDYLYNYELRSKKDKLTEEDHESNFYLGLFYLTSGDNTKAEEYLNKVTDGKNKHLALFFKAIAIDDAAKYENALTAYELLEDEPLKSLAQSNKGFTHIELFLLNKNKTCHLVKAVECFEVRIKAKHEDIVAIYGLAITYKLGEKIETVKDKKVSYNNKEVELKKFTEYSKTANKILKISEYEHLYSRKQLERTFERLNQYVLNAALTTVQADDSESNENK